MTDANRFYTPVRPEDEATVRRGLTCLLAGPEGGPGGDAARVKLQLDQFFSYATGTGMNLYRQVLAMDQGKIAATCLWVPAPGRTAMLFTPGFVEFPQTAAPAVAAIVGALDDAKKSGIHLVQTMIDPDDLTAQRVFGAAGLAPLATLDYLERKPPATAPATALPPGVTLEPYSPAVHEQFNHAIEASYQGTLDCPGLSGLRDTEDVLAGHKAVGTFDPQLWSLVLFDGQLGGALLLSEIPARRALETVYLGLAPFARGKGIGRALMHRTLAIGVHRAFELLSLAVDADNGPALKLYRRAGYASVARRVAFVKSLR